MSSVWSGSGLEAVVVQVHVNKGCLISDHTLPITCLFTCLLSPLFILPRFPPAPCLLAPNLKHHRIENRSFGSRCCINIILAGFSIHKLWKMLKHLKQDSQSNSNSFVQGSQKLALVLTKSSNIVLAWSSSATPYSNSNFLSLSESFEARIK